MNRKTNVNITQILLDILFLAAIYPLAVFITGGVFDAISMNDYIWIPVLYGMVYIITMFSCEMYYRSTFTYQDRILRFILQSSLLASLFCLVMMPFASRHNMGLDFLAIYLLTALVVMSFKYLAFLELRASGSGRYGRKAVLIGYWENIQEYLYYIRKTSFQVDVVGFIPFDEVPESGRSLGSIENLEFILKENVIAEVIFAVPAEKLEDIKPHIMACRERGLTVKVAINLFDSSDSMTSVHNIGTIPVITWQAAGFSDFQSFSKRILDLLGSIIGISIFFLISVVVIPLIKLRIGGSVFIRSHYLSLNGRSFILRVFRTAANQETENEKSTPKALIGRILKNSGLDRLPMIWNVFRGDMSLVGTIPVPAADANTYSNKQCANIFIKPGLTGIWRFTDMSGHGSDDFIVELNNLYIKKWSVNKDIWLIIKTVYAVMTKRSSVRLLSAHEETHKSEITYNLSR